MPLGKQVGALTVYYPIADYEEYSTGLAGDAPGTSSGYDYCYGMGSVNVAEYAEYPSSVPGAEGCGGPAKNKYTGPCCECGGDGYVSYSVL